MNLTDVFKEAARLSDFPIVEVNAQIKNHPNMQGKIMQIRPDGVSVNLGAKWDKWFHLEKGTDKRSNYMSELSFPKIKEQGETTCKKILQVQKEGKECLDNIDFELCERGLREGTCLGCPSLNPNFKELKDKEEYSCTNCQGNGCEVCNGLGTLSN